MVDPVTSGFIGWVCGKLADKVLGNLMKSRELNHEIDKVVNKWTKSLNGDRYVDADVLFSAVELAEDGEERKCYLALQTKLLKSQWPDQDEWQRAFVEQWKYVRKTNEEPQPFFGLEEAEASRELEGLAEAVDGIRKEYERVFRWVVIDELSEIKEYLRKYLPGVKVGDIGRRRISMAKLPVTWRELFGREDELKILDEAWADEKTKIISFVAWGGVGKTALVNEWLNRMGERDWGGAERVYGWSFYSQGTKEDRQASSDTFLAKALEWFGDKETAESAKSPWYKGVRLAELIREEKTLLILDGVEPLQYPPGPMQGRVKDHGLQGLLRELSHGADGLCIITTREDIKDLEHCVGHSVKRVELENLSPEAGMQVLREAGVKGLDKELKETSKEFGGHALALTLLGNYLAVVHNGEIRKRDLVPALMEEEREGGHAKRVMKSYEIWLEGTAESDILYLMGLFDRPAEAGAIKKLREGPVIKELTENIVSLPEAKWKYAVKHLRELKLLAKEEEGQPDDLDCHPLIREHFGEKLKKEKPDAWRETHGRLYEYYKGVPKKDEPDTLEEMEPLFRAVYHGCAAGKQQELFEEVYWKRICRGGDYFVAHKLGAFGSWLGVLAGFFDELWKKPNKNLRDNDVAVILNNAGGTLRALGRLREAAEPMEACLSYDVENENKKWEYAPVAAGILSETYLTLGDVKGAVEYGRRSVEYADKSGNVFRQFKSKYRLANSFLHAGKILEAEKEFKKAETLLKQFYPQLRFTFSVEGFWFCDLLLEQGQLSQVEERGQYSLKEYSQKNKVLLDIALDKLSLGKAELTELRIGKLEGKGAEKCLKEAKRWLDEAVDGLRKAGTQHHIPRGLLSRAGYYRFQRSWERARGDLEEVREIAERGEMKLHLADYHLESARVCLNEGRKGDAKGHYEEAKALIEECGYHRRDEELKDIEGRM